MHDAEAVYEIEALVRKAKPFAVCPLEAYGGNAVSFCALHRDADRRFGQVGADHFAETEAGEDNRIDADATAGLQQVPGFSVM